MKPQTTLQILRCLTLGRYTVRVEGGELRIRGPQAIAGPLPASIKARRDELVAYLNEHCGGTWPPAPGSAVHTSLRRDARRREWMQKSREERTREFRQRLREGRKRREGAV